MRRRLLVVPVLLLAVAAGGWWWFRQRGGADPDDLLRASGTVEATEARLAFSVGGRLARVAPREGDAVVSGAELATLADEEARAALAQAEAQVAAAEARLVELRAGPRAEEVAQAEAERRAAAERMADAERDLARANTLAGGGAIPREAAEEAELARDLAAARLDQATAQAGLVRRGARAEQVAAQAAVVEQARAGREAAAAALDRSVLRAPFAGLVTVRHREPGEVVAPGVPVLTLLDREDRWVRIYVPEPRLGAVRLGAPASIRSDSFPGKTYRGVVVHLASEAEFTPRNVQTAEERALLVYAVKVRVADDPAFELKPGLPVDVELPLAAAEASRQ
jgi:HlyD family secretion protein